MQYGKSNVFYSSFFLSLPGAHAFTLRYDGKPMAIMRNPEVSETQRVVLVGQYVTYITCKSFKTFFFTTSNFPYFFCLHAQPPTKWKPSWNMYSSTQCIHDFCKFGADLRGQSVLISKNFYIRALSQKFIKGALLVGYLFKKKLLSLPLRCTRTTRRRGAPGPGDSTTRDTRTSR